MSVATLPAGQRHWTRELADAVLPDTVQRREVLEGELVVPVNAPHPRHQVAVATLFEQLIRARPPGWYVLTSPLDVPMPWGDVAQPDLVVCSPDQLDLDTGVTAPPALVLEVLSPSTRRHDLVVKRRLFERLGIERYVIVDVHGPEMTMLGQDPDGRLVEVSRAASIELTEPFPVRLALA